MGTVSNNSGLALEFKWVCLCGLSVCPARSYCTVRKASPSGTPPSVQRVGGLTCLPGPAAGHTCSGGLLACKVSREQSARVGVVCAWGRAQSVSACRVRAMCVVCAQGGDATPAELHG